VKKKNAMGGYCEDRHEGGKKGLDHKSPRHLQLHDSSGKEKEMRGNEPSPETPGHAIGGGKKTAIGARRRAHAPIDRKRGGVKFARDTDSWEVENCDCRVRFKKREQGEKQRTTGQVTENPN